MGVQSAKSQDHKNHSSDNDLAIILLYKLAQVQAARAALPALRARNVAAQEQRNGGGGQDYGVDGHQDKAVQPFPTSRRWWRYRRRLVDRRRPALPAMPRHWD